MSAINNFFKPLTIHDLTNSKLMILNTEFLQQLDFAGKDLIVYTDGSCISLTKGGFAVVVINQTGDIYFHHKGYRKTTSQRMELSAILYSLQYLVPEYSINLKTDSQYSSNTYNEWMDKWAKDNFKGKKNIDLVEQIYKIKKLYSTQISISWTKAHNGTLFNEIADDLADPLRWSDNELFIDPAFSE